MTARTGNAHPGRVAGRQPEDAGQAPGGARQGPGEVGHLPWDLEPELEIWVRPGAAEVVVVASGRLDAVTAEGLARAVESVGDDAHSVLLDLSDIESLPGGWGAVDEHVAALRERGIVVGIIGAPGKAPSPG